MYTPSDEQRAMLKSRFTYHPPKKDQVARYETLRDQTGKLADLYMRKCPASVELDNAIAKLSEAVMWANASIARNESDESSGPTRLERIAEVQFGGKPQDECNCSNPSQPVDFKGVAVCKNCGGIIEQV